MALVSDQKSRDRAKTATDRNIVVSAGAGTGKTSLLVDRLIHLLLYKDPPLSLNEVVALTFTNKAANEMKTRLRRQLAGLQNHQAARTALVELEQSQIGTIHSFAAHLLRLYPIEGAVDPTFQQDEGGRFDEQFAREWPIWFDGELGAEGRNHDAWRQVLGALSLDDLTTLAKALCGELIALDRVTALQGGSLPSILQQWFEELADRAERLVQAHGKRTTIDDLLTQAATLLRQAASHGLETVTGNSLFADLDRGVPAQTTAWTEEEYRRAKQVLSIARSCFTLQQVPLQLALQRLVPFAASFRQAFLATGYVSFDGLLARCCTMLRDHPEIRRQLKRRVRSILVDEFQDTDPVQYELILYLAEAEGDEAPDWREIRLEPGKLFIVGDPKQSIYAFRRADIEAYDRVVQECVLGQQVPGEAHKLQTNFRSHPRLLRTINAFFSGIFPSVPEVGLQPQHDPLAPCTSDEVVLEQERVDLRIAVADEEEPDAEVATRVEAEGLARWLAEDVIGIQHIMDDGEAVTIQPRHIAVLFRTLGPLRDYVEAFRRYAIPCQAEGERHFYERQEVLDAVNILRAAANPRDKLALVGVLRSVVGGLADAEVAALAEGGLLDYRIVHPGSDPGKAVCQAFDRVRPLYELLVGLHRDLPRLPLPDIFPALLARVPLIELAAASMDRDQAVGNLLKLQDLASDLARRPAMTFARLVREFAQRTTDVPQEAEMSMAEDEPIDDNHAGVLRLLSMHKAKGLEFPVVILAGLHRVPNRQSDVASVHHDWSTGIVGARVGPFQTVGGLYTTAKLAERRWAEQSRLLYVGMTRAKRKLVLSAGLPANLQADSFLSCIATRLGLDLKNSESIQADRELICGDERISLFVQKEGRGQDRRPVAQPPVWGVIEILDGSLATRWAERRRRCLELSSQPMFLTPTMLQQDGPEIVVRSGRREVPNWTDPLRLGTIAHRLLEQWDFAWSPSACQEEVGRMLHDQLAGEPDDQRQALWDELRSMLMRFVSMPVYRDLQRATILGREVPFLVPWGDQQQIMSGTIDLLYRLDGQLWIVDYKTDDVKAEVVREKLEQYRLQAQIYTAAIAQSLRVESPLFQFIFLRPGLAATL